MQHIPKKWLWLVEAGFVFIDVLVLAIYVYINVLGEVSSATEEYWGTSILIPILGGAHLLYMATISWWLERKQTWIVHTISMSVFGIFLAALIEVTHNVNLLYQSFYLIFSFFFAALGPIVALAAGTLAFVLFIFILFGATSSSALQIGFFVELGLNFGSVIISYLGWLFFRRHYVMSREAAAAQQLGTLLKQEQFKSSVVLESITDGVLIVNTEGTIQMINASLATMLGWPKSEALKLNYRSIIKSAEHEGQDVNQIVDDVIGEALVGQKGSGGVTLLTTKNKREVYVDIVASPLFENTTSNEGEETQRLVGIIAVLRDVDGQKRQEQQRSDFISTASHEMRTPVASIQGFLELLMIQKACQDDEKVRSYIQKAHDTTVHLGELFQDLLTVSKSDEGKLTHTPQIIDVAVFLKDLVQQKQADAAKKDLKLSFDADSHPQTIAPLIQIVADSERLREVIDNLLDNAIKYTQAGLITIGASAKDDTVILRVTDTGMGIAEEDIPHLFQKFYRVDTTAIREVGGTGLGLYICKQLVELMGGTIWVKSTLNAGSTFYIALPRVQS